MIEIPRATLVADEIAEVAEFFSFGTNDLTQMTFGSPAMTSTLLSILTFPKKSSLLTRSTLLDQHGVGQLVNLGIQLGRTSRPKLKVGVCGEHGGDPASIEFFYKAGMNYVSCSPFRVPVARLAAAQAAIKNAKCDCGCC
jgi:pyruvate,orthophosphate dikinase